MNVPLVSVVMPVYNASAFVEEAVQSILNQTFSNWELIVIDDGSTDSSPQIIEKHLADKRIKYIRKEKNEGIVSALNLGISLTRGKYVARMDADDISLPHRLEKQVEWMEKKPQTVVCGANYFTLTENKKEIIRVSHKGNFLKTQLFFSTPFCHPLVMINKSLAGHDLHYKEEFSHAEDYELWTRLAFKGEFHILEDALFVYRNHPLQVSHEKKRTQLRLNNEIRKKFFVECFGFSDERLLEGLNLAGNNVCIMRKEELMKIKSGIEFLLERQTPEFLNSKDAKECLLKFWADSCGNHKLGFLPVYYYWKLKHANFFNGFIYWLKCSVKSILRGLFLRKKTFIP
ncbi:MAG: glycosyltransferase [Bacteroidia bacterium]|nr:glycosyltransferase [Bacteroidia bacterium]